MLHSYLGLIEQFQLHSIPCDPFHLFFFFNDTPPTEISTLPLHDALPISLLPQLNGTAAVTRDHSAGFQDQISTIAVPVTPANPSGVSFFVQPEPLVADTTTKKWALNLRQNVFSWSNWMTLKGAGREVAQAEATYQAAEQQLILRVAQTYFNVLASEDGLEANQASLEAISRQLDQANKRFEVGLIAITDVQEAKAARDTAE